MSTAQGDHAITMPLFSPNFPTPSHTGDSVLMPIPERTWAVPQYTGRGVVIAFLDSGFYPHPDLSGRVLTYVNATQDHITESTDSDHFSGLCWHGQMTSVIAAGDGTASNGAYIGIANRAKLVLVKISDPYGRVKEHDILRGLHWVLANHQRYHIRVVNLSVGGDFVDLSRDHPLHQVVDLLTEAGIVVVAAVGNSPDMQPVPPATAATVITVGGYDDRNTLNREHWSAYHHSYGVNVDGERLPHLIAPAVWIPSPILPDTEVARAAQWLGRLLHTDDNTSVRRLLLRGWSDLGISRQQAQRPNAEIFHLLQEKIHQYKLIHSHYQHVDGTSVAAPIVTAVVAQMLEANPSLSPLQVRELLQQTSHPLHQIPIEKQGAGALNAAAAVRAAEQGQGFNA